MTFAIDERCSKISLYSAIFALVSSCSLIRASISSPISLYRRISNIAPACLSVKSRPAACFFDCSDLNLIPSTLPLTRQSFAILRLALPRNISIIRSIISQALIRPSLISLLAFSFSRSVVYFLVASSYWKLMWCFIISLIPKVSGLPSTIASIFTPNVSSCKEDFQDS